MKIVIEIPEKQYENLAKIANVGKEPLGYWERVVMRGTPLSEVLKTIRGDIWLDGVNMTGEYQGVWTRFRDVEKAFDKALKEESE